MLLHTCLLSWPLLFLHPPPRWNVLFVSPKYLSRKSINVLIVSLSVVPLVSSIISTPRRRQRRTA